MCSFDICSLFTCVSILETVDICADMLYWSYLTPPDIPEEVFVELMKFATTSVEFSFDNIMYRQVDWISMGSALGLTMTGIFVGFHEVDLLPKNALRFNLEKLNNSTLPFLDVLVRKETSAF